MPLPRPIYTKTGVPFDTVQEAVLFALKLHESQAQSPSYKGYYEDLLRHLVDDLREIRNSIAARAVPDEEMERAA
jgi:hypothetical protein